MLVCLKAARFRAAIFCWNGRGIFFANPDGLNAGLRVGSRQVEKIRY